MKKKPIIEKRAISTASVHENALLNRIYQNRGVVDAADIEYSLSEMLSPFLMKDMKKGAEIIIEHIRAKSKILIVGDYDCDGATSTTIAMEGLSMLGATNIEFLIPDRVKHGYGLTRSIVAMAELHEPDLIITVDNGISAFDGAKAVMEMKRKCDLVVTDHHLQAPEGLPDAKAIINPNRLDCEFPSKNIAGCGVIFCTVVAVRSLMREMGVFEELAIKEPNLSPLLDVLAMGTICDVVRLDKNNRIFVNAGLTMINRGVCRPGLKRILELKGKEVGKIMSSDFGFSAGPCINAAGRLEDMSIGIRCLMEANPIQADAYAQCLVNLNETRKEIESSMLETALSKVDDEGCKSDGIVIYDPTWHEGVVGIVASRIKDRFDRPTICFTNTHHLTDAMADLKQAKQNRMPPEKIKELEDAVRCCEIKGSARSIEGIHMKHLLDKIAKLHPNILYKFGGHAMAAGLSIQAKYLKEFKVIFNDLISAEMNDEMRIGSVSVDIVNIDPALLTLENADLIDKQPVWGAGFESPQFSQNFEIISKKVLKEKHLKLKVKERVSGMTFDAIAFNCVSNGIIPVDIELEASFKLSVNEFRGMRNLQLMISHLHDSRLASSEKEEPSSNREIQGIASKKK